MGILESRAILVGMSEALKDEKYGTKEEREKCNLNNMRHMSLKLRPCQTDTQAAPEMRILNYEELLEAATSFLSSVYGSGKIFL